MRAQAIDVVARARELPPFTPTSLGEVDGVTLALCRGGGEMSFWHVNECDELQYCVQGSCTFLLRADGHELAPVEAGAGDLVVVPAGVEHRVLAGPDSVVLNVVRQSAGAVVEERP